MEPKSVAATMLQLQQAIANCERSGNAEWLVKHRESLAQLCTLLPSGSGIDCGTKLESISLVPERIKLVCSFHHHTEQGYAGWTEHVIRVLPSFVGLTLTISGVNRDDIKDYLHDVYFTCMSALVLWDASASRWIEVRHVSVM